MPRSAKPCRPRRLSKAPPNSCTCAPTTFEEDVVLPTGVTLYVYGEGYSEGDLGAVLTVPAGKTLSVEATSKNLNVMKNSTLAVEEGGTVLLEGGSYKASAQLGCVSVQLGAALTGTLSVPAGKVLFNAANKYYYAGDQSAIVAQVSNDGVPGRAFVLSSLANFVSQNGDTLTLLADQSEVSLGVGASDVTIDLGGKVLSGRTGKTSAVITASGTNLNVKRGTIKAADKNEAAIAISAGANAIVASDATIEGGQTLGVFLKNLRASLVVEGSISSTSNYAISGNGNGDSDDTSITVKEGASIKSEGATAIYHPQIGELNVEGGSISGTTGVDMRSGSLTMTGGEVKGTGAFAESANDGGRMTTGVGIAVVQHVTLHDLSVSIEGGTVAGTKNAVRQKTLVTDTSAVDKVKLNISGGTFTCDDAASDAASVYSENCTGFVAGGTYVGDPLAYLAQGCTSHANADGTYTVSQPTASVAASDGTAVSYGTFAEAWAAATDGSTLTLLADAALSDEAVLDGKRSVTFDLNGFNVVFGKAGTISITEGELNVINSVPGKGGTISAVEEASKAPFGVTGNTDAATWSKVSTKSKLTIGAGVTVEAWASAVAIQGQGRDPRRARHAARHVSECRHPGKRHGGRHHQQRRHHRHRVRGRGRRRRHRHLLAAVGHADHQGRNGQGRLHGHRDARRHAHHVRRRGGRQRPRAVSSMRVTTARRPTAPASRSPSTRRSCRSRSPSPAARCRAMQRFTRVTRKRTTPIP